MIAAFLLLAAVLLRDDTNTVPPQRWRYERFVTKDQLPVTVDCRFKVQQGPDVRVELMTQENLDALRRGQPHESISTSTSGDLSQEIGVPGTFAIAIFNDDKSLTADVSLRITLDFAAHPMAATGVLSAERKFVVILLSFVGFLAIVAISAHKLIDAMRNSRAISSRTQDAAGLIPPTPGPGPG